MSDIGSFWLLLFVVGGLYLLIRGADHLVDGASALALSVGISPLLIGLTIVAFGTSAPELATCLRAVIRESQLPPGGVPTASQFALGNVVGSNICNLALVLAIAMMVVRHSVQRSLIKRELPFLAVLSVGLVLLVETSGLTRTAGVALLAAFLAFCAWSTWESLTQSRVARRLRTEGPDAQGPNAEALEEDADPGLEIDLETLRTMTGRQAVGFILMGLLVLTGGAELLVQSAGALALRLSVPEEFIGLTIVAIGTSLPELATTLVAARKDNLDLGLGNVIGSNVFNIGLVVGLPAALYGWPVDESAIRFDLAVMLGFTFLVIVAATLRRGLGWKLGVALLATYLLYLGVLVTETVSNRP